LCGGWDERRQTEQAGGSGNVSCGKGALVGKIRYIFYAIRYIFYLIRYIFYAIRYIFYAPLSRFTFVAMLPPFLHVLTCPS
jgi:hypothetical protein